MASATPSALHTEATRLHREGRLAEAEALYRDAYSESKFAASAVGLAQLLLLGTGPSDSRDPKQRQIEARALVRSAVEDAVLLAPHTAAIVLSRCGYFHLLDSGALRVAGSDVGHGGATPDVECLGSAVSVLERAVALDSSAALPWRNLSKAYRFLDRLDDAAQASGRAIDALRSAGKTVPAPALYEHAKALRRVRRFADAAAVLCDALDADPDHQLAAFCLRVTQAACDVPGGPPLPPLLAERIQRCLSSSGSASTASHPVIPLDYVRLLFDGYASKFESHLTEQLEYRTPSALLALALAEAGKGGAGTPPPSRRWARCADLGCGTGLIGALVQPYVGFLAGVDLSPGMITEVERTRPGVYDELAVGDVEAWLRKAPAANVAIPTTAAECGGTLKFDLIFCADVLVYIPELRSLFQAVAESMETETTPGAPALFLCSTEADTSGNLVSASAATGTASGSCGPGSTSTLAGSTNCQPPATATGSGTGTGSDSDSLAEWIESDSTPGFRLLSSGRCCHRREYVVSAAAAAGLVLVHVERRPIRKNAGLDIIGDLFVFKKRPAGTSSLLAAGLSG